MPRPNRHSTPLRFIRRALGLTQIQLAFLLDVAPQTVIGIENRHFEASKDKLVALAYLLGGDRLARDLIDVYAQMYAEDLYETVKRVRNRVARAGSSVRARVGASRPKEVSEDEMNALLSPQ